MDRRDFLKKAGIGAGSMIRMPPVTKPRITVDFSKLPAGSTHKLMPQ